MKINYDLPCISVVIPVYNVEKYLSRCIDSVIAQHYKNLDIILVDDGSTDSSGRICDEYKAFDSRIRVFHKINGGLSDARNFGITKSKGIYITFIDSDDYVTNDYVSFLYELISNANYRMSICSLYTYFASNQKIINQGNDSIVELSVTEALNSLCYNKLVDTCAYAKLYDIHLFDNIKFPVGKLYEDTGTVYRLIDQCDKIMCGFSPKYYYYIRDNSITNSAFSVRKLDMLDMADEMAYYILNKYPALKAAVTRKQVYARFSVLNQMLDVNDKKYIGIRKEIIKFIKNNSFQVLCDTYAPMRDKIAIVLLNIGYHVYKLCWKWHRYRERT